MKNAFKIAAALVLAAVACFLGSMNCSANESGDVVYMAEYSS